MLNKWIGIETALSGWWIGRNGDVGHFYRQQRYGTVSVVSSGQQSNTRQNTAETNGKGTIRPRGLRPHSRTEKGSAQQHAGHHHHAGSNTIVGHGQAAEQLMRPRPADAKPALRS